MTVNGILKLRRRERQIRKALSRAKIGDGWARNVPSMLPVFGFGPSTRRAVLILEKKNEEKFARLQGATTFVAVLQE